MYVIYKKKKKRRSNDEGGAGKCITKSNISTGVNNCMI